MHLKPEGETRNGMRKKVQMYNHLANDYVFQCFSLCRG